MKLYTYNRSSAAYRVRIALNLKSIEWQSEAVNLLNAEEQGDEYLAVNAQGVVPTLDDNGFVLGQSMAILEYLEEKYPTPALLPKDLQGRAIVRAMANTIACDIHPLNNLKVLKYLVGELSTNAIDKMTWYAHWIEQGFVALEAKLQQHSKGQYCYGDSITFADILLVPQVYNANRFDVDMRPFSLIRSINEACLTQAAFQRATPENQADFA